MNNGVFFLLFYDDFCDDTEYVWNNGVIIIATELISRVEFEIEMIIIGITTQTYPILSPIFTLSKYQSHSRGRR